VAPAVQQRTFQNRGRCIAAQRRHDDAGAVEETKPLLGLHGHIHEGRGTTRIGRTLCINPGSMYEQGTLLGAMVALGKDKIENYVLTSG
jgi:Icc-related predicted phosphoesterase